MIHATVPRGTIPHPEPPQIAPLPPAPTNRAPVLREIPLTQISVLPDTNPRTHFDAGELKALTDSIAEHGLLQPIVVRPGPGPLPTWILVAGAMLVFAGPGFRSAVVLGAASLLVWYLAAFALRHLLVRRMPRLLPPPG